MDLDVVLAPSNPQQLAELATDVSSPTSPLYDHYLSEGQFAAQFGPAPSSVQSAESWLRADGLAVSRSSAFVISVVATAGAASRAFGVQFDRYKTEAGATGIVASGSPLLPADLAGGEVTGVVGLNTLDAPQYFASRPAHRYGQVTRPRARAIAAPAAPAGPGTLGGPTRAAAPAMAVSPPTACPAATAAAGAHEYTANELATNYQFNELDADGQDGAGVTIAVPELNASSSTDISTYLACFGLSNAVSVTDVDGGPAAGSVTDGEADLDIEMSATLAPGTSIDAYEGPDTDAALLDEMNDIVLSDTAKVISMSVGQCEALTTTSFEGSMHTLLEEAATQGQSVLVATGDQGSEGCFGTDNTEGDPTAGTSLDAQYPASDPLVTAVGGSVLTSNGELAWNDCNGTGSISCAEGFGSFGASGGGLSAVYSSGSGQPILSGSGGGHGNCRMYRRRPGASTALMSSSMSTGHGAHGSGLALAPRYGPPWWPTGTHPACPRREISIVSCTTCTTTAIARRRSRKSSMATTRPPHLPLRRGAMTTRRPTQESMQRVAATIW